MTTGTKSSGHNPTQRPDPFRDRVAVITGGGSGMGAGMAAAFAARGAKIVLADLDAAAMARVEEDLRARGAQVLSVVADVTKLESMEQLAQRAFAHFGAVHVVCNNAGVAHFGEMRTATHRDWEYVINVDLWGVIHGVEAFVSRIVAQGQGGHILNTASMAGLVGMQWLGIYCTAKFAVVGLSESLRRELAPHGIGVSVLCPMIVDTPINQNSVRMRPKELRNPGDHEILPAAAAADMRGGVISVAEAVRRILQGIDRNDLYILTHPEQREFLRRRAANLDRMFEEGTW